MDHRQPVVSRQALTFPRDLGKRVPSHWASRLFRNKNPLRTVGIRTLTSRLHELARMRAVRNKCRHEGDLAIPSKGIRCECQGHPLLPDAFENNTDLVAKATRCTLQVESLVLQPFEAAPGSP
eukprot:scaffold144_cov166-Pinguiococcus_pyrenoidosus.AAC.1